MATSVTVLDSGEQCPDCDGRISSGRQERVCTNCGLVVDDSPVDHGPDWGRADHGQTKERAKPANPNHPDRGLGSRMGFDKSESSQQATRVRIQEKRSRNGTKKDRNRGYTTTEIQRITSALELGDTLAKQAKSVFRQYHDTGIEGEDLDSLAAACVFNVVRIHNRGVTACEIAEYARNGDGRKITRCAARVSRSLGLEVPPPAISQRVRVVARDAPISKRAVDDAAELADSLSGEFVSGYKPSVIAAACLYECGGEMVTQRECADAAGVSSHALRSQWKRITKHVETDKEI